MEQFPTTPIQALFLHSRCHTLSLTSHPMVAWLPSRSYHACAGGVKSEQPVTEMHMFLLKYEENITVLNIFEKPLTSIF